ncbi:hypothetical protein ACFSUD_05210 [Sulfitobacter aestuarii]|uniref:Transglycosylase SLT domain-containing protein n=1 Tax=Sulfitobacter aestuarii TaxID=2161676 RepID=A0ABW5U1D1_9RHOB
MKIRRIQQLYHLVEKQTRFPHEVRMMAAAVTATEMSFRSLPHRLAEYLYATVLILLGRDAGHVSIGISQVSIRHYATLENASQLMALKLSLSAEHNLRICCKFVQQVEGRSLISVARAYNGRSTFFYKKALAENYSALQQLEAISIATSKCQAPTVRNFR